MVKWPLDKAVWDIWTLKVWANRNNIAESDGTLANCIQKLGAAYAQGAARRLYDNLRGRAVNKQNDWNANKAFPSDQAGFNLHALCVLGNDRADAGDWK